VSVTLDYGCAVREMWEKLSSDGGESGSKKCKRGYGGAYGVIWRSLCLAGVWSQVVGFVLVFDRNLASVAVKMCSHLVLLKRHFINCVLSMRFANIKLQYIVLLFNTKRFIPVNFDGSYYASNRIITTTASLCVLPMYHFTQSLSRKSLNTVSYL
jgi:hypothetical protein